MISAETRTRKAQPAPSTPTEYLLRGYSGQLSQVMVYRLVAEGFTLRDVQDMLSSSNLYSKKEVLARILGKSIRTIRRQGRSKGQVRLNSYQSAVAFQYATVLEHAVDVFGTQRLAEEWLGRTCRYLDGDIPLDVIDNPLGFQAVKVYLEGIKYGTYQ